MGVEPSGDAFNAIELQNGMNRPFNPMDQYRGDHHHSAIPAKSGVAGGVMAVVNRQVGIATYSPRLDAHGNRARGIEACVDLAGQLGLHVFDCLNMGSSFLDALLEPVSD